MWRLVCNKISLMKFFKYCLILILFCGGVSSAFASTPAQEASIDRRPLFEKAYQVLPYVIAAAYDMALVNNDFTGDEMRTIAKIFEIVLEDLCCSKQSRLVFSEDQSLFKLDPKEPVRTAVTSSDPRDPFFINSKVINARNNQFEIENALQLLVHEYGHKIEGKDQADVDSVAAKIQEFISRYITRTTTNRGEVLTALTIGTSFGRQTVSLWKGRKLLEQVQGSTALFLQTPKKILNLSEFWAAYLANHPTYIAKQSNIRVNHEYKIWQMDYIKSVGSVDYFSIDYAQNAAATPSGTLEHDDLRATARQLSGDYKAEIEIDKETGTMKTRIANSLVEQPDLRARIKTSKALSFNKLELVVEMLTPNNFKNYQLNVETEFESFALKAKSVSRDFRQVVFEIDLPQFSKDTALILRSIILEGQAVVMFDEGASLKVPGMNIPSGKPKILNYVIVDDKGPLDFKNPRALNPDNARMLITVEAPLDIQEVRIGTRRNHSVLQPETYFNKGQAIPAISPNQIESLYSWYKANNYDPSEFTQTRKGNLVEISVPIIRNTSDMSGRESRGSDKLLTFAINEGLHAITSLQILDRGLNLESLDMQARSHPYVVKTPHTKEYNFRPLTAPKAMLCSDVL